ncbi:MAG: hypothetical protein H8D67_07855 [Deltaproteobacteria bacterium]|nr:hypothetical protein [Deltaproteobacteria bacterium]
MRFESVGMMEAEDGIHWHAVPPPVIDWGDWPQMSVGEVGAIEKISDRYYLMLGYGEGGLGGRQVLISPAGRSGMYSFVGDSPDGCTEIATMDNRGSFNSVYRAETGIEHGKKHSFRLLLRGTMLEFYLDDLLMCVFY